MKSDVVLSLGHTTLIIDAKYYSHATQHQYNTHSVHSHNLYQIFTYVKNKEAELARADVPHEVSDVAVRANRRGNTARWRLQNEREPD